MPKTVLPSMPETYDAMVIDSAKKRCLIPLRMVDLLPCNDGVRIESHSDQRALWP